jgi:hypothetical protein
MSSPCFFSSTFSRVCSKVGNLFHWKQSCWQLDYFKHASQEQIRRGSFLISPFSCLFANLWHSFICPQPFESLILNTWYCLQFLSEAVIPESPMFVPQFPDQGKNACEYIVIPRRKVVCVEVMWYGHAWLSFICVMSNLGICMISYVI